MSFVLRTQAGALVLTCFLAGLSLAAVPGTLPLKTFASTEGVASDITYSIYSDSRGYLWIGTNDGLTRFDGQRFVSYSMDDGLPHRNVGDIVEDRSGAIWIGTVGGVARLDPNGHTGRPFTSIPSPDTSYMSVVHVDRRGVVRAACGSDLCVYENGRFRFDPSFRAAGGKGEIRSIADTPSGELWIGTRYGVMRRDANGTWRHFDVRAGQADDDAKVAFDAAGRLWVTTQKEAIVFASREAVDDRPFVDRVVATYQPGMRVTLPKRGEAIAITAPSNGMIFCQRPFWSRDGATWIGTGIGVLRLQNNGALELLDSRAGLPRINFLNIGGDAAGNVWIASGGFGVVRVALRGAITLTTADGLGDDRITSLVETEDEVCATNLVGISCIGEGAPRNAPLVPGQDMAPGLSLGWNQVVVRDASKQWWVATGEGLVQWPLLGQSKARIYTTRDGLPSNGIFRIWQDSKQTLWISTIGVAALVTRDPATGSFAKFPNFPESAPTAFAEDRAGNIWVGTFHGHVIRLRDQGLEIIKDGVTEGFVRDLKVDSRGRLWIAKAGGGVLRIDDPTAKRIVVKHYARADGLSSDVAYCLAETADHRMAIGSTRGLDLLDPETGRITRLTTNDGLPSNVLFVAHTDKHGTLWLGTFRGLARIPLLPDARPAPPVRPRITSIEVNGEAVKLPELGAISLGGILVQYPQRRMKIGFSAPHFDLAQSIRFEYRLGADRKWTAAGQARDASYERLPFGEGTFEVRTVNAAGVTSPVSRATFEVATPVWLRPWFVALAALALISTAIFVHRYRVAHLLAMERLRRRVATDLHDDLGSSLSRISILSSVAKESADRHLLEEIGDTARDLVGALGDSIWSVDPQRDDMQSLLSRVRHFATEMLEAKSMALEFRVPAELAAIPLDPERRRALYLILKEALNNAARHSDARRVIVTGALEQGQLRFEVEDDGKGYSSTPSERREDGGRGVTNMSERARRVGGTVSVQSTLGVGTRVCVAVPV